MIVRRIQGHDQHGLTDIFAAQGFSYTLPNLAEFSHLQILADESNQARIAVGCRNLAEVFMLVDPSWETPKVRMEGLSIIHESMRKELAQANVSEAVAWLPPQIAKPFGNRLMRTFGWYKPEWPCVALKIGE